MNRVSFHFAASCCILQWHSFRDSSRSCVSSSLAARISYSFDLQLNLFIFSTRLPHYCLLAKSAV